MCDKSVKDLTVTELLNLIKEVNIEQTLEIKSELNITLSQLNCSFIDIRKKVTDLEAKIAIIDRRNRRNNIVIFGLKIENKTELLQETVHKIGELLECTISHLDVNNIYITNKEIENPPIILEFVSYWKKQQLAKQFSKLRGTGVSIANDSSYEDRQKLKILKKHLIQAREQNLPSKIKGLRLEIDGELFSVEDLQKLEHNVSSAGEEENKIISTQAQEASGHNKSPIKEDKVNKETKISQIKYSPKTRSRRVAK